MIRPYPNSSFFPKPRKKNPGSTGPSTPATKKQINSFEEEYQKFIADLKAKKEAEAKKEETPVVEEPKAEVIPETVTTVAEDAPVLNEKKTKKKKVETVVETVAEPTIDGLD